MPTLSGHIIEAQASSSSSQQPGIKPAPRPNVSLFGVVARACGIAALLLISRKEMSSLFRLGRRRSNSLIPLESLKSDVIALGDSRKPESIGIRSMALKF